MCIEFCGRGVHLWLEFDTHLPLRQLLLEEHRKEIESDETNKLPPYPLTILYCLSLELKPPTHHSRQLCSIALRCCALEPGCSCACSAQYVIPAEFCCGNYLGSIARLWGCRCSVAAAIEHAGVARPVCAAADRAIHETP